MSFRRLLELVDLRAGFALAAVAFLPTIGYVGFHAPSYAFGTFVAVLILVGLWSGADGKRSLRRTNIKVDRSVWFVVVALLLQSVGVMVMTEDFQYVRFAASAGLLLVTMLGAICMASLLNSAAEVKVARTFAVVTVALILMAVVGALGWNPFDDKLSHMPLFIFAEPSHFVLIFAPFMLWAVVMSRAILLRVLLFTSALAIVMLAKNMTMFILISLAALIALRARALVLMVLCLLNVALWYPAYFFSRLDVFGSKPNLTVLVWRQGWQEALFAMKSTTGVGLGFQQLGLHGVQGEAAIRIAERLKLETGVVNGTLNVLDGGTVGAKLAAEFGVLGVVLIITSSFLIVRGFQKLRGFAVDEEAPSTLVFFYSCIVSFALDLFVRGTGYFAPWVLLFWVGFFGLKQVGLSNADGPLRGA